MKQFVILKNGFLSIDVNAFYHDDYKGGMNKHRIEGTIEHLICSFKNDITATPSAVLAQCMERLCCILKADLAEIVRQQRLQNPVVCVVPRAKVNYRPNQLLFKAAVKQTLSSLFGVEDGSDYIIRTVDTRTTHRDRHGYGGNGKMPYPGITLDSCTISDNVRGREIILIDDLYTKTVNIDEDAIEALLKKGAKSVTFYSIGRTVSRF